MLFATDESIQRIKTSATAAVAVEMGAQSRKVSHATFSTTKWLAFIAHCNKVCMYLSAGLQCPCLPKNRNENEKNIN